MNGYRIGTPEPEDEANCERCGEPGRFTGETYLHGTFCPDCKQSFRRWMEGALTDVAITHFPGPKNGDVS